MSKGALQPLPVLVWLLLNSSAVVFALTGVALSAAWPQPAEAAAVDVLLVMQLVSVSVLFAWLLAEVWTAVMIGLIGVGFVLIAADLAQLPHAEMFHVGQRSASIVALGAVWSWAVRGGNPAVDADLPGRLPGVYALWGGVATVGMGWMAYVSQEFEGSDALARWSPLHAVLSRGGSWWEIAVVFFGAAIVVRLARQVVHRKHPIT